MKRLLLLSARYVLFFSSCLLGIPASLFATPTLDTLLVRIDEGNLDSLDLHMASILQEVSTPKDSCDIYYAIGRAFINLDQYEQSLAYLDLVLGVDEKQIRPNYAKGLALALMGDHFNAITFYEKAIRYSQHATTDRSPAIEGFSHQNIGKIYTRLGDYEQAIEYVNEATRIFRELGGWEAQIAIGFGELGTAYSYKGNQDTAYYYYQIALGMPELGSEPRGVVLLNVADYFLQKRRFTEGLVEAQKAFTLFEQEATYYLTREKEDNRQKLQDKVEFQRFQGFQAEALRTIGQLQKEANTPQEALASYRQAIQLGEKAEEGIDARELAKTRVALANLQLELHQDEEALASFQAALADVLPAFQPTKSDALPTKEQLYSEWVILDALVGTAQIFQRKYTTEKALSLLEHSLQCYELATGVEDALRQSYDFESSKLMIAARNHKRAAHAIATAYELYQAKKEERYLESAFHFAERNKAGVLLESVSDLTARYRAGIPDSLLAEERTLQEKTISLELEVQRLQRISAAPQELEEVSQQRFQARQLHQQLKDQLARDYPEYYELKYQSRTPTLKAVQSTLLAPQKAFIEYFLGDEYLFVFVISKKKVEFLRLARDSSLTQAVTGLLEGITSAEDTALGDYIGSATTLYQQLIAPLPLDGFTHLTIAPDLELSLVPFDALLSTDPTNRFNFQTYPYLIKEYTISYAYSAGMRLHIHSRAEARPAPDSSFLGMAPVSFQHLELGPLNNTAQEVQSLQAQLGGQAFMADEATKRRFLQYAEEYKVIHLATHARGWDKTLRTAWIAFSGQTAAEGRLTLPELYALRLRAELVVLGACETGTGALRRGEGVMSLARGMTYAGSQSTVMSLWSVRAEAAGDILKAFYQHLQDGLPKDEALRRAKLAYFQGKSTSVSQGHPVMWAALVAIGDMKPLVPAKGGWVIWVILWLGILAFLWWWKWGRKGKGES